MSHAPIRIATALKKAMRLPRLRKMKMRTRVPRAATTTKQGAYNGLIERKCRRLHPKNPSQKPKAPNRVLQLLMTRKPARPSGQGLIHLQQQVELLADRWIQVVVSA